MENPSVAVFDPKAFYPFRSLVQGGLQDRNDIPEIERFVRAIVLHDEMSMILEPVSYDPVSDEEMSKMHPGPRNIITGMGPVLSHYEGLLSKAKNLEAISQEKISAPLCDIAAEFSNAGPGNPYYDTHVNFIGKILAVLQNGGSIICNSRFSNALEFRANQYPEKLFEMLDRDWQEYASSLRVGNVGFEIPPILNIVLTNCKRREDIPDSLKQLREEWAKARKKVWKLLGSLRNAESIKEAVSIQHELDEASSFFSPFSQQIQLSPIRILWDLFSEGGAGAFGASLASGDLLIGTIAGAGKEVIGRLAQSGKQASKLIFGRGAFDLARRVRKDLMNSSCKDVLSGFLTQKEKDALGI